MSQITKSLKTRIQEISASVEEQKAELAAYEHLLQIELAKESAPTQQSPNGTPSQTKPMLPPSASAAPAVERAAIPFTGNKTSLVADIVKSAGNAGVLPKDVDKVFSSRRIKRSKNFIYNTLSYLASREKLHRREGRYFAVVASPVTRKDDASPTKRKLSPAGLKAIREGVKKRWAAKRAADRKAAKSK